MEATYYTGKYSLTQKQLKIIAIIAMLIDHLCHAFIPWNSPWTQVLRFIGRFTMPIMCYFIAEGYEKTRNKWKYFGRLMFFAALSHFPFQLAMWGRILPYNPSAGILGGMETGVMFTLGMGLLSLMIVKSDKIPWILKGILLFPVLYISQIGDYGYYGVLWVLFFGVYHHNRKLMTSTFLIITLSMVWSSFYIPALYFNVGTLLAIVPILLYNGKKGEGSSMKWFFYLFYPVHLFIIFLIKYFLVTPQVFIR